jgi:hypothetical protein
MRCTDCGSEWPDDAVLCVQCGLDFRTGRRLATVRGRSQQDVAAAWDRDLSGWASRVRVITTVVFLVVLTGLLVAVPFIPQLELPGLLILGLPVYLISVPLILYVWGGYTRIQIDPGGERGPVLTVRRYFFFLPRAHHTYRLRDFQAVWTDYYLAGSDDLAHDVFLLDLGGGDYDILARVRVYEGNSEATMHELCDLLQQAGGLEIKRR